MFDIIVILKVYSPEASGEYVKIYGKEHDIYIVRRGGGKVVNAASEVAPTVSLPFLRATVRDGSVFFDVPSGDGGGVFGEMTAPVLALDGYSSSFAVREARWTFNEESGEVGVERVGASEVDASVPWACVLTAKDGVIEVRAFRDTDAVGFRR